MMDMYTQEQLREPLCGLRTDGSDQAGASAGNRLYGARRTFFQAMDIVQGYDFRWRFFLERESDELRKPLIMVNAEGRCAGGRPGTFKRCLRPRRGQGTLISGTATIYQVARWALQPNKGIDLLAPRLS